MTAKIERIFDGGLPAGQDALVRDPPADPAVGENHGFWFFEDGGAFSFHVHLEANSPLWAVRREMVHVLLADGRVMSDWQFGLGTSPEGPGSACTRTREIAPFDRWDLNYAGMPLAAAGAAMASGPVDLDRAQRVPVELQLELTMAADPWVQGSLTPGGMTEDAKAAIGAFRHEQLLRGHGHLRVGSETREVHGTGLRTHRIGSRSMANFAGHSWLSVLFPSGRGIAFQRQYLPDGSISFDEGFVTFDGTLLPVQILEAPIMRAQFSDEVFKAVVVHDGREVVIHGETVAIHHWSRNPEDGRNRMQFGADLSAPGNFVLNNGCVRCEWDGEVGFGLLERSARAANI